MLKSNRKCWCGSGKKRLKCCDDPKLRVAKEMLAQVEKIAAERSCEECQVCCEIMGVSELGKPYTTRCEHQCPSGCAIYGSRPPGCRSFFCFWKMMGVFPDDLRPDKSGVLLCFDKLTSEDGEQTYLFVYEAWEGAIAAMPQSIHAFVNSYLGNNRDNRVMMVPYGERQGTSYRAAPKYSRTDSFNRMIPSSSPDQRLWIMGDNATYEAFLKRLADSVVAHPDL